MLTDDFNEYAKKKKMDITVEKIIFTPSNSTVYTDGGKITIQSLLQSQSQKYDIYFYNFSNYFGVKDHLLDLGEYILPPLIRFYDSDIFRKTCFADNKLIGFVNAIIN